MGAYLSSPVTDKISSDKTCSAFTYGASSMQGWRISQEDAHNCIPDLDSKTAMFAVYDGHGGAEVAQYCSRFLPQCIKETDQYKEGELGPALVDAFLKFDSTLVQEEVIKELKLLAGCDENDEEEDDEDPVGRGEADDLRAEADLPLDELLAKYQSPPSAAAAKNLHKKEKIQSPAIRSKQSQPGGSAEAGPCSSTDAAAGSSSYEGASNSSSVGLTNGLADNENNLNKEKELKDNVQSQTAEQKRDDAGDSGYANSSGANSTDGCAGSGIGGSSVVNVADDSSGAGDAGGSGMGCSSSSAGGSSEGGSSNSSSVQDKSSDKDSGGAVSSASCAENESRSGSGAGGSNKGSDSSQAGGSGSKVEKNGQKKVENLNEEEDDSDSDEDDEDEWQDISGEEDEDDEEEEEEDMDGADEPIMDMSNEEPGSDSGCTACVALLREDCLVVANAGDSRCVLCRGDQAVDLSVDHKPEDDIEKDRIEKAGGKVTADGRVNGGLNLSRALGDHFYKRKEDLPPEQQMITALPDIQMIKIEPEDQFIVLACDGIWNSMSSQQCVDFVAERIKDPLKKNKPSIICEEMFDHCLAANTYGDGTGCDNMTCVIVVLNHPGQPEVDGTTPIPTKRNVLEVESPEDNLEKKPRVEEVEGSTSG